MCTPKDPGCAQAPHTPRVGRRVVACRASCRGPCRGTWASCRRPPYYIVTQKPMLRSQRRVVSAQRRVVSAQRRVAGLLCRIVARFCVVLECSVIVLCHDTKHRIATHLISQAPRAHLTIRNIYSCFTYRKTP